MKLTGSIFAPTMRRLLIIIQSHRNPKETKENIWEGQETLKLGLCSNYPEIPPREVQQIWPKYGGVWTQG